ncbi:hypothetical protein [Synechococcus sp. CBW1107]|nr:hypothetical protein [Synechococcus sp. CBW1107]CAK6696154.1 hypothetical protein IFHNHDMJ_01967 [Synechococcus sp. CBW1107]
MIAASNLAELAVSGAVSLFGLNSKAILASHVITNRKQMPYLRF